MTERAERMRQGREARERMQTTFAADPEARIPLAELPSFLSRLDADGDGYVTKAEVDEARHRQRDRQQDEGPKDRSSYTMLHPQGFPLNVEPEIVAASEAGVGDEDIVMGIVLNGHARAYPVNYMNGPFNEIVNDTLGGTPIASTW